MSIPGFTADYIICGPRDAATHQSTSSQFKSAASHATIIPQHQNTCLYRGSL